jgi:hypothetical protein
MGYSGARGKLIHEKTRSKKSRDTVPLSTFRVFCILRGIWPKGPTPVSQSVEVGHCIAPGIDFRQLLPPVHRSTLLRRTFRLISCMKKEYLEKKRIVFFRCGSRRCEGSVTRPMWGRGKIGSNFEERPKSSRWRKIEKERPAGIQRFGLVCCHSIR